MNKNILVEQFKKKYKKALVTGGAGFIGSHIVSELLEMGIEVICVDNFRAGKYENIKKFLTHPKFQLAKVDITDYNALKKLFVDIDIVFHEAASKKNVCLNNPRMDLKINGEGTFNLLELSRDTQVKKFVHASTGSVYGEAKILPQNETHPLEPVSYYGVSKLAGERYAKAFETLYGLNVTILRYFHVYGPNQDFSEYGGVIAIFINNLLNNLNPVIFGDGSQERSFTYVKDVVNVNLLVSVNEQTKGEVYNCASGININLNDLLNILRKELDANNRLNPVYKDWTVGDIRKFQISNKKLLNIGFKFLYDFQTGLKETIQYFQKRN
jgi:UDP-glucose 4-epimerase